VRANTLHTAPTIFQAVPQHTLQLCTLIVLRTLLQLFPLFFFFFHRGSCRSVCSHIAALNTVCTRKDKTMHTTRVHKLQNTRIIIKMMYLVTCFACAKLLRVLKHKGILGLGVNSRDNYPPPRSGQVSQSVSVYKVAGFPAFLPSGGVTTQHCSARIRTRRTLPYFDVTTQHCSARIRTRRTLSYSSTNEFWG
jgi:hypothetical protein